MFNVNKDSIEYGKEVTFMVALTDNEGNILNEEYTFLINKDDDKILFSEEGNNRLNIHRYLFKEDDIGKVSIIVRDSNGREANVKLNVIPEFPMAYIIFGGGLIILFIVGYTIKILK